MATRTSQIPNLITPGLRKVYFSTLKDVPQEARQLFNFLPARPGKNSGLNYFDDARVASLGTWAAKPQGQAIEYDDLMDDTTVRYTPYVYGLGFRATEEAREDDLHDVIKNMNKELAYGGMNMFEVQCFRILNSGFGTTGGGRGLTVAGFNSEALFSTSHALVRGGTYNNRSTTDLDLSVTAIEDALIIMANNVNDSSMPMPLKPTTIVHSPNLRFIAREIADSELMPYTGTNEVNPLRAEGLKYMEVHYLTDSDSWFLLTAKQFHDLNVWVRRSFSYEDSYDFDTGDFKIRGTFRIAQGHGAWQGTFGSQGV